MTLREDLQNVDLFTALPDAHPEVPRLLLGILVRRIEDIELAQRS